MCVVPLAVFREILLRLPAESLLRFRAVSKRWRAVIDEPCFAKAHIDNQVSSNTIIIRNSNGPLFYPLYHFNLDDLNFTDAPQTIPVTPLTLSRGGLPRLKSLPLSACNGLLLIAPEQEHREVHWEIWNPLTGECLKLPDPNTSLQVVAMGLGYDYAADDYRVVVIDYDGESTRRTHVYSLKSDTWREVGDCEFGFRTQKGVFVNGSLHWVSSCDAKIIIAFDFATENFRKLALPPGFQKTPESVQLESLGGCLFLTYIGLRNRCDKKHKHFKCPYRNSFDVWVMNDYGGKYHWIKLFSLREKYKLRFSGKDIRLVAYMKNENRVLMQYENRFIWFDFGCDSVKTVDIHGFSRRCSATSAQHFVGSLLRLHDGCGRDASKIITMKRRTIKEAHTTITFCVRDPKNYEKRHPTLHDDCYNIDSNWFPYSCQGDEIHTASSDPDSDSFIPLDICREIFLHLAAKSLIRFRVVCKSYRDIITNHALSEPTPTINHALNFTDNFQRIPTTPLGFTHSGLSHFSASVCNSLILIADEKWEMWNPLTDECLQLPRGEFNSDITASGLCYDYASDDYKVVCIDRFPPQDVEEHEWVAYVYRTHVYSLRSDSWRMVGNFPLDHYLWGPECPGVFLSGALHWTSWGMDKIIALDIRTENYSQLQWPPLRRRRLIILDGKRYLDVLGGCLVMIDFVIADGGGDDYMDVWVMKDYGAEDSWINVVSIHDKMIVGRDIRPIAYMKNESQILLQSGWGLFLFDGESDSMKWLRIHGLTEERSYAHAFPGSIFRLHDNCGSGSSTRQRTRIRKRAQMEISDTELYFSVSSISQSNCHRLEANCLPMRTQIGNYFMFNT